MNNRYLDIFLQLQSSLRDQLRAAPTKEEAQLINEDLSLVDEAIQSLNTAIESDKKKDEQHASLMATGKAAADSLREMVAALECDYDRLEELREMKADGDTIMDADEAEELAELESQAGECTSEEEARIRIHEDALGVEVRSDWHQPGDDSVNEPTEFRILLSTGGPASRIVGELRDGEPISAALEVQDWFMPWTEYNGDEVSESVLLDYCRCFYLGEG